MASANTRLGGSDVRPQVLVFGGTAEGRLLVEWLDGRDTCDIVACTATEYGASLLFGGEHVTALQGPLSPEQKQTLMSDHHFCCIVDATHPFALHISESIAALALEHGVDLLRIERENTEDGTWVGVENVEEAARYLATTTGNIMLTTGSKDLATFVKHIPDFNDRVWARLLPVVDSVSHAKELGVPTDRILALQGPFSTQLNCAFIREYSINHLVTKQSGATGGFGEKIAAAKECDCELVVILRPVQETGLFLEDAKKELEANYGL
ncbi:MAG: precorrin-6A reductase [Eggerthellaceae bacterium]|nr:precorrin-6A reductase [Eggerthellaceae bacterium]